MNPLEIYALILRVKNQKFLLKSFISINKQILRFKHKNSIEIYDIDRNSMIADKCLCI